MIHRINIFILSLILVFSQTIIIVNANASTIAGWNITSQIAQGASTIINATKSAIENGVNVVKNSTAKITPSVSHVSKVLRGGAYGYAISIAVEQILGKAVDWVLDPANNQITYKESVGGTKYQDPITKILYDSASAALTQMCINKVGTDGVIKTITQTSSTQVKGECDDPKTSYPTDWSMYASIVTNTQQQEKKISLDTIAAQVISNAESHPDEQKKAGAQSVTTASAEDMLANDAATQSDVENQLNTNAKTQTSEQATGNTKPNETNPEITDISLSFPAFCGWAPTVCQAANVVINFPTTLTNWWDITNTKAESWAASISEAWTSVKDWVKTEEPVQTDTTVDIQAPPEVPTDNNYLYWDAYCPFNAQSSSLEINGEASALDSDLTSWCTMATEIKPFVLLAGALASLMIVSGVSIRGDE